MSCAHGHNLIWTEGGTGKHEKITLWLNGKVQEVISGELGTVFLPRQDKKLSPGFVLIGGMVGNLHGLQRKLFKHTDNLD